MFSDFLLPNQPMLVGKMYPSAGKPLIATPTAKLILPALIIVRPALQSLRFTIESPQNLIMIITIFIPDLM